MFFKKGTLLMEIEAKWLKVCYLDKGLRDFFERIELDGGVTVAVAVKEYGERHGIRPCAAYIIVKCPEVKARYIRMTGTPPKMANKEIQAIEWLSTAHMQEKMIEDYCIVDVCNGSTCIFWAALPERLVMGYVNALKGLGITVERADVYHNCIARGFRNKGDKELLVIFRYFDEAGIVYLKNGVMAGIKDIMFDYEYPQEEKLFQAIVSGFSWMSLEKVYILNEELGFAKGYFEERGVPCRVLTGEETEFLGIENL